MADLDDEAALAAFGLVRQAIETSRAPAPAGNVMDVVQPYLVRTHPQLANLPAGTMVDIELPAELRRLIALLAQVAGASFQAYIEARNGTEGVSVEELTGRLTVMEQAWLAEMMKEDGDAGPDQP